jgi:hypothetical protein
VDLRLEERQQRPGVYRGVVAIDGRFGRVPELTGRRQLVRLGFANFKAVA